MTTASVQHFLVIYPRLPVDLLGKTVGETEDAIFSMFGLVHQSDRPVVLILDGLEHILLDRVSGEEPSATAGDQALLRRSQSCFLTLMANTAAKPGSNALILCTTCRQDDSSCSRFDRVFHLKPPDDSERKAILESIFLEGTRDGITKGNECTNDELQSLLYDLVEATVGKTYSELVQYCRQTLEYVARYEKPISPSTALLTLKERLQTTTPESLKSGYLGDSFDMRVLNARDLRSMNPSLLGLSNGRYDFPMKGQSAATAWKELEESIVLPLCRSKELEGLLYRDGGVEDQIMSGGLLLTGEPGTGKTEIAMHCARYASFLLPNVKLLDVSCTSLIHKEVGGSERAVRHLFESARKAAPCILLLGGIENIAAVRGNDPTTEGTLDRVLSTLLTELDGIDTVRRESAGHMAIIGITHNANWIDPALKRPGRLQKTIVLHRDWI